MLTMPTLKYVKLFYRLYRKGVILHKTGFQHRFCRGVFPVLCWIGVRPVAPAGRVVLSIPISPPSLLCFPAAAVLLPTAEGQSHPSRVCLTGKVEFTGAVWLKWNENEVRELSKMEETQDEGLSNSYFYFWLSGAVYRSFCRLCSLGKHTAELWQPNFSFP